MKGDSRVAFEVQRERVFPEKLEVLDSGLGVARLQARLTAWGATGGSNCAPNYIRLTVGIYDNQTRSMRETDQKLAAIESTHSGMKKNADGSVTVWLAPKASRSGGQLGADQAGQGVEHALAALRTIAAWFDRSWKPGDFELVK